MSFSLEVKNEVARLDSTRLELTSELSAIIRNSIASIDSIIINTESNVLARRIFKLFKSIYDVIPVITVRKKYNFNKNISYILEIKEKTKEILEDLSIIDKKGNYLNIPKDYVLADEEMVRAYIRGLFLTVGSINDPKTSRYHLELSLSNKEYALFIEKKLNTFYLNSKMLKRDKNYMVYIKEAEKISDFLRIIKAYKAVLYFEDIRIYRDHKNMTNRLNNCEQANMDKVFLTSMEQLKDIEKLKEYDLVELLDDKIKEAIYYREKYPENSLSELSEIITKETGKSITKSGLNHRFRKIKETLKKYEDDKNETLWENKL